MKIKDNNAFLKICFLLFISCISAYVYSFEMPRTLPLENDGVIYIIADVKKAKSIIDILPIRGLKNWQTVLVTETTHTAAAAFFNIDSGREYQVTASGNYPRLPAAIVLFFHWQWKSHRTGTENYWFSDRSRLSISIESNQVSMISWREHRVNPVSETNSTILPSTFINFGRGAPLSCWMKAPDILLNKMLENEEIPVMIPAEELFFSLYVTRDNKIEIKFMIRFESISLAQETAANLASRTAHRRNETDSVLSSLFFANPPVQNGIYVNLVSAPLTNEDALELIGVFRTGWRHIQLPDTQAIPRNERTPLAHMAK